MRTIRASSPGGVGDPMGDLVVVYRSQGPLEAEVALAKLSSEGIPAILRYEALGRALGLTVDGMGLVEVVVAEADASRATALLEQDAGAELAAEVDLDVIDEEQGTA